MLSAARSGNHFVSWRLIDSMDRQEHLEVSNVRSPRGTVMPMNSKRLMKTYLSRINEKLELPAKASTEEMRQIIEGKLWEMGKKPHNVQVEVAVREQGEFIFLRDVDEVFLEVRPHVVVLRKDHSAPESSKEQVTKGETPDDSESLCTALAKAQSQNEALADEVKRLREELK